jgi:Fe-S-cluster formation regulator IscX/YfhJ
MDELDHWKICEELSVVEAATLSVGEDPSLPRSRRTHVKERSPRWTATFTALKRAVLSKRLRAKIRHKAWIRGWNEEPGEGEKSTKKVELFQEQDEFTKEADIARLAEIIYWAEPDWDLTTVRVDDLREWFASQGVKSGFFFRKENDSASVLDPRLPIFLDSRHPNYSAKLAAAVTAWQAVSDDPKLRAAKSVKAALTRWLRDNAGKLGLTNKSGSVNEQAIEEIAKVANWEPQGGAPKTPGK